MYRTTELPITARRTSIGDARTGLLTPKTPEIALGFHISRPNKRLLVLVGSEKTEERCLEFARRFADANSAEIRVVKPTSADPADEVRRSAITLKADWLCMVTHGGPGLMTLFLKSEDERVLRAAPCPVVCIPETLQPSSEVESVNRILRPVKRILVPISSPRDARNILACAVELAERFRARIDLLRVEELIPKSIDSKERSFRGARRARTVASRDELARLAENTIPKRLRGRNTVSLGLPLFYVTPRVMRESETDLVVLATPSRRWSANARIDIGTERILRGANCPVICVPEGNARADAPSNRELGVTRLGDWRESWPVTDRHSGRRAPTSIFAHRKCETGVASSMVATNDTNIYDPYETEIAFNR